ncbi:PAS domain S-box protein [Sphingosinicella sp. BN140058]|uniref:PAS domain S-box protein n=1 Tax=Sphingosinicella sp. BN140058 TaxID=1892855 RepID=UPI001013888E|nr:PAS domain S-box protein [Sphingosinicella sp. BN140058]QAY76729.1 PAS domain S-box protein [Sphingosinicella sp. BN140058]
MPQDGNEAPAASPENAVAALQEQLAISRLVMEHAADAIFLLNASGETVYANPAAEAMFGWSKAELTGRKLHERVHDRHPDGRPYPMEDCPLGRVFFNGRSLRAHQDVFFHRDGRPVFVECSNAPVLRDGAVEGGVLIVRDVSDTRRAQQALAESEARFRTMADSAPVMMWVTDPDGHCTYLNRRWYEYTGQAPGAGEGLGWTDAIHPDDRNIARDAFLGANADRREYRVDFRLRRADGAYRWTLDAAAPRFGADGAYLGYVGSVIDIDDRREAAERLALNEERLRLALDVAEIGQWDVDVATSAIFWSPRVRAMFGVSADLPVTLDIFYEGVHPEDREKTRAAFEAAADPTRRLLYDVEYRTVGRDDNIIRWVAAKGRGLFDDAGRCVRVIGTAIDITARKAAQVALAESRARYQILFESIESGFCVVQVDLQSPGGRVDYRVLEANPAFYRQTGFPTEILGRWLRDAAPALEEKWFETYGRVARTGVPERFEQASDSLGRWFDVYAFRLGDAGDGRVAILFNDISARRDAEERLRALNESLESQVAERTADRDRIWRLTTDVILVARMDGIVTAVNPAWTALLGWREDELVGQCFLDLIHPDDRPATRAGAQLLAQGDTLHRFENRYRAKDGAYHWISWSAVPFEGLVHAVGRDVTAEKAAAAELDAAQEALRQAQKMEAMGQLTGGVAHDFNNLLTPIVGGLDMLQRKALGGEREQRLIAGAMQSAERAKTLVQRLLAFARRQPLQASAVDVGALVTGMADLVASTSGPQIRVAVETADAMPPARADANQLEMALLNLGVNARDAMPDGGTLRITADCESVAPGHRTNLAAGRYIRLSVADTGIGMDEATLKRAVEPFFSTKGVGKGTGLGLSSAHGLASQLGGALTIDSRPNVGTNVTLWLPVSADGSAADAAAKPPSSSTADAPQPAAATTGTALLVDDEDLVRISTADMLAELGYAVVEAASAEEAFRLLEDGLAPDLLVTDHLMPGINGTDLARSVRAERPQTSVLVISGYAENDGIDVDLPRLTKPFRKAELAAKLGELGEG